MYAGSVSVPRPGSSPAGASPQTLAKSEVEVGKSRPITSGSDVSEDEEHDEAIGKAAPGDIKKVKRYMISHPTTSPLPINDSNHPNK